MHGIVHVLVGAAIAAFALNAVTGAAHAVGAPAVGACGAYGYSYGYARMGTVRAGQLQ